MHLTYVLRPILRILRRGIAERCRVVHSITGSAPCEFQKFLLHLRTAVVLESSRWNVICRALFATRAEIRRKGEGRGRKIRGNL